MKIIRFLYLKVLYLTSLISPVMATNLIYFSRFHKKLNLENPKTFNEKLQWLKLNTYYNNKLITIGVDKYKVREYVKECGCEEILNELYFVWDSPEHIKWETLPKSFALKCNHGCGYNIICEDKDKLDINESKKKLKKWYKENWWPKFAEYQYKFVEKKIICEKYLQDNDKAKLPVDYKIHCFNGKAEFILVCVEREKGIKLYYFDTNWKPLDIGIDGKKELARPKSLMKMIDAAEKMAKQFPFVRVDFYEINEKPIFGELTFIPEGGVIHYFKEEVQLSLGEKINIKNLK